VRRLLVVCLAGFAGGSLGGFLIACLPDVFARPPDFNSETALSSAIVGVAVGAPFGTIAFPACYYLLMKSVPMKFSLAVTFLATVVVASLFEVLPIYSPSITYSGWTSGLVARIYGPPLLGLLLSSIALNMFSPKPVESGSRLRLRR
jgi:hypothetical protein